MRKRSQAFGRTTCVTLAKTSGSCRATHMTLGAVKPGMAILPVIWRQSGKRCSKSEHSDSAVCRSRAGKGVARYRFHQAERHHVAVPRGRCRALRRVPRGGFGAGHQVHEGLHRTSHPGPARSIPDKGGSPPVFLYGQQSRSGSGQPEPL